MRKLLAVIAILPLAGCVVTPKPFSENEINAQGDERLRTVTADQEPVVRSITLHEAMARALKYNLDFKVEQMEAALRTRELKLSQYDLLPDLVANGGYAGRNNFSGASSSALLGPRNVGAQSLVASTSAERDIFTSDLTLSWDLLDFGLSYIRSKQRADEVLIAEERKRNVINRIIEDVRTAYWRAVSAERLINQLTTLEDDITDALSSSTQAFERRNLPPLSALTYQRELLTIKDEIQRLHGDLSVAKKQLAALMNIDPGTHFELHIPERSNEAQPFNLKPEEMVSVALRNRPELREISYEQRINEKEAMTALLELLPSLRSFGGFNHDSNNFLFNNNWAAWGARASWNVIDVFRYPARKKTIKAQEDLLKQRALALSMAVITQVHVSATRYELARRRLGTQYLYHDVQGKIMTQIDAGYNAKRISRQTFIREQMNKIVSEAKYDIAFAELQNALANIYSSMGLDPLSVDINTDDTIEDITQKLEDHWKEREGLPSFLQSIAHVDTPREKVEL